MKKLLLLITAVIIASSSYAIYVLKPEGLKRAYDEEYLKINIPESLNLTIEADREMLINNIDSIYERRIYGNAKDEQRDKITVKEFYSIAEREQSILIQASAKGKIRSDCTPKAIKPTIDIDFSVRSDYSSTEVIIHTPVILDMAVSGNIMDKQPYYIVGMKIMGMSNGVYNKKGQLLSEMTKDTIEYFFETYENHLTCWYYDLKKKSVE